MATIEPVKQDIINPGRVKKNSFNIRLWHWLNVIIISGSLLTVLINSTILSRKPTTALITEQLTKAGITNPAAAAQQTAHELSDRVWEFHGYIGLVLVSLLLYRLVIEFIQPQTQRLFKRLSIARHKLNDTGNEHFLARHEFTVKLIYLGFYIILGVMAVTGLSLFFEEKLGLSKSFAHQIKEVHGFCMYIVIAFILVHIVGVLLAEKKQSPGIISDMVNGGKEEV